MIKIYLAICVSHRASMLRLAKRVKTERFQSYRYLISAKIMREVHQIKLNDTETQIRDVLVDFCQYYNLNHTPPLELRITGGWVRDKLLGNESHDIDIAIDHMTGEDFATQLHSWLSSHRPELSLKAIHTIKKNPEKSKHLETCTTKLFGCDIDFVNLRLESYGENLRVPIIKFGSAEEDALRRDATLNALFYNLNQDKIEDFTGRGLDDLKQGILRTPLSPKQTFLDDPLRVLRLIRFACRFRFEIDAETLEAMLEPEIKEALKSKISRERVGIELEKILEGDYPEYGLQLINYLGLAKSIFNAGDQQPLLQQLNEVQDMNKLNSGFDKLGHQINLATAVYSKYRLLKGSSNLFSSLRDQRLFWLAVILAPFGDLKLRMNPKKDMKVSAVQILLREGVKFGNKENDIVATLVTNHVNCSKELESYLGEVDQVSDNLNATSLEDVKPMTTSLSRSQIGFYLRKFGSNAQLNLELNCFLEILDRLAECKIETTKPDPNEAIRIEPEETVESIIALTILRYNRLRETIKKLNLSNVDTLKPIVDGKLMIQIVKGMGSQYSKVKGGQWMSGFLEDVLKWQLDHPDCTASEATDWIKQEIPKRNII